MDFSDLFRVALALLFAAALLWQSRLLHGRPNQRRTYQLAGAALLLVGLLNAALAAGLADATIQMTVGGVAIILLLAAAVFYLRGFRSGEMRGDAQRASEMAREYRERREREIDERRGR
ncbi:MAG: hypothetical protein RLZZ387_1695 [Chloroflexota bacterium]|jgi:drug/metabolite transporter (DMT)-like permease